MCTGQPRDQARLLLRPLFSRGGTFLRDALAVAKPFPAAGTRALDTDNQVVRLKDGSLLALKDTFLWDRIKKEPPAWFEEIVTGSGDRVGQRGGEVLFRSVDCGETWRTHSTIDMASFLGGKYGRRDP